MKYNIVNFILFLCIVRFGNAQITFGPLPAKTFGDRNFRITASSSSTLPIMFSSANSTIASILSQGGMDSIQIRGAGIVNITAYNTGTSTIRILSISKATQVITISNLNRTFGDTPFILGTSSSGLPVSYSSSNTNGVVLFNSNTITILKADTVTLSIFHTGDNNYNPATPYRRHLTINKATQVINFNISTTNRTFGEIFLVSASTNRSLPILYSSNNTLVIINNNTITTKGTGTCIITAYNIGNENYTAASESDSIIIKNTQTISIRKTYTTNSNGYKVIQITAKSTSTLPVTVTISNTNIASISSTLVNDSTVATITPASSGHATLNISQTGNDNYWDAYVSDNIEIRNTHISSIYPVNVQLGEQFIVYGNNFSSDTKLRTGTTSLPIIERGETFLKTYIPQNLEDTATFRRKLYPIEAYEFFSSHVYQVGVSSYAPQRIYIWNKLGERIPTPSHVYNVVDVSATGDVWDDYAIALTKDGRVISIVGNVTVPSDLTDVVKIYLKNHLANPYTGYYVIAIKSNGSVVQWYTPHFQIPTSIYNGVDITGGSLHCIVLSRDESIQVFERIRIIFSQGESTYNFFNNVVPANAISVIALAATDSKSAVLKSDSTVITWGGSENYYIGNRWQAWDANGSRIAANGIRNVISIAGSRTDFISLTRDNKVYIGNTVVDTVPGALKVVGGSNHFLVLTKKIVIQVGGGNVPFINKPVAVSAGKEYSIALFSGEPQSISFTPIPHKKVSDVLFVLSATASSNLPLFYTISDTNVGSINGNTLHIKNIGTVTITAYQSGDHFYLQAPQVKQQLVIETGDQIITFPPIANKNTIPIYFILSATSSFKLPVSYSTSSTIVSMESNTVKIKESGTLSITAYNTGNANYFPTSQTSNIFTIQKTNQAIDFFVTPYIIQDTAPYILSASSDSELDILFSSASTLVNIKNDSLSILNTGSVSITAYQPGNNYYNPASATSNVFVFASQTITMYNNKASQTITFENIPTLTVGSSYILQATASSGLPIYFNSTNALITINGNTLTAVATGTSVIIATQEGNAYYNPAITTQNITVINNILPIPLPIPLTFTETLNDKIHIFPSPPKDYIIIQYHKTQNILSIKIYNITGTVFTYPISDTSVQHIRLDIKNLPKGEYILVIYGEKQNVLKTEKIIINKPF